MEQNETHPNSREAPPPELRQRVAHWFRRLRERIVMDAPPDWDVHPDVAKKIREREEP